MQQLLVLVVPRDPVIGRLLVTLVEMAGHRAVLPRADESPQAALVRLGCAAVMIDCDHPLAYSERFLAEAAAAGTRVMLFSGSRTERETEYLASSRGLAAFTLPNGPRRLAQTLESAMAI